MERNPFIIGLTGNIASGKSTVLHYLAAKGAHAIDADQLAHRSMAPDGIAYPQIVDAFGEAILTEDGRIDRSALGRIVFNDAVALQQLEAIVHPAVLQLVEAELATSAAPIVIIEAIKLLEAKNLSRLCNEIWVVTASPETQLRRLQAERGIDEAAARQRMASQTSQAEKVKQADRTIGNDGTPQELYAQLDALWAELVRKVMT